MSTQQSFFQPQQQGNFFQPQQQQGFSGFQPQQQEQTVEVEQASGFQFSQAPSWVKTSDQNQVQAEPPQAEPEFQPQQPQFVLPPQVQQFAFPQQPSYQQRQAEWQAQRQAELYEAQQQQAEFQAQQQQAEFEAQQQQQVAWQAQQQQGFPTPTQMPAMKFQGQQGLFSPQENPFLSNLKKKRTHFGGDEEIYQEQEPEQSVFESKRTFTGEREFVEMKPPDEATLTLLHQTGSILWCKGKPFEEKLKESLGTIERMEWNQRQQNQNPNQNRGFHVPPMGGNQSKLDEKIEIIKIEQVCNFVTHYNTLEDGVKLTISKSDPKFQTELNRIVQGDYNNTSEFGYILACIWQDLKN